MRVKTISVERSKQFHLHFSCYLPLNKNKVTPVILFHKVTVSLSSPPTSRSLPQCTFVSLSAQFVPTGTGMRVIDDAFNKPVGTNRSVTMF